jgi:fucose 4-O-acetylase-like acetyltransferase
MQSVTWRGSIAQAVYRTDNLTRRNGAVDALRFLAALVIVLFHAKLPVGGMMAAAMGVFTALLACHAATGQEPMGQVVRRRFDRLIRPFAVWAAIYAALRMTDAAASRRDVLPDLMAWLPPEGTMAQLWYLPFAFSVCIGIAALRRSIGTWPGPALSIGFAAVGSLLWFRLIGMFALPIGVQVFVNFMPSVFFGLALASMAGQRGMTAALAAASVGTGFVGQMTGAPVPEQLWIGMPLVIAAHLCPVAATPLLRRASDLTMTIYLLHPLVIAVLLRLTPFDLATTVLGIASVLTSVVFSLWLASTRMGRLLA